MSFNDVWAAGSEMDWNRLLHKYWSAVKIDNIQIEYELNRLVPERIARMNGVAWYDFLHDEYFVWKYTAKNRLATTRMHLRKYITEGDLESLDRVRARLMTIDPKQIAESLSVACEVRGLGVAGGSGLLSLIYPTHFATVDQFVVKALLEVDECRSKVAAMNPMGLVIKDGVVLTKIIRDKASEMNRKFASRFWTPRTLEMALWAYRA